MHSLSSLMQKSDMPEIGEEYRRTNGDKQVIKVIAFSAEGYIKIKDSNGLHFVRESTFKRYFKRAKEG